MVMGFVKVVESILLHGYPTKSGYLLGIPLGLVLGIFGYIRESGKIARYEEKKQHMTKRIDVVIAKKERIELKWHHYRYIYTFSGLDEYKGISFYDKSALVEKSHIEGERVSLLINERNVEEFWFEEEVEPDKEVLILAIVVIFLSLVTIPFVIWEWESLPW